MRIRQLLNGALELPKSKNNRRKFVLSDGHIKMVVCVTFSTISPRDYYLSARCTFVQALYPKTPAGDKKQALCNLFAAYFHTVPLEELIGSVERARLHAKLRYVVIYGAACSYCLAGAERLEGSYLRTFAVELKEQLAKVKKTVDKTATACG